MPRTEETRGGVPSDSGAVQTFEQSATKATAEFTFRYPKIVSTLMNEGGADLGAREVHRLHITFCYELKRRLAMMAATSTQHHQSATYPGLS